MSWKVRKVYTRKLVDAQYCATLLLLAVPCCLLALIFAYTLRLHPTPHYGMLGIIIIIYTYIVLGFLYGHKVSRQLHLGRREGGGGKGAPLALPLVTSSKGGPKAMVLKIS